MRKTPLTKAQTQEILALFEELKSTKRVLAATAYGYHQVWHVVKRAGLNPRRGDICSDRKGEIQNMYRDGMPLKDIADEVGVSLSLLSLFVCKEGWDRPPLPTSLPGELAPRWKGGLHKDKDGYLRKHSPDHPSSTARGYVLLHRLVMEESLDRYLSGVEVVHHIDHDRTNNAPENLQLFPDQTAHRRHHAKLQRQSAGRQGDASHS